MQVSQETVSGVLNVFVNSIVSKAPRYVYIPTSEEEPLRVVNKFKQIAELSGVIGAIDSSHIPIIAPSVDNRKGFHFINM